MNQANEPTAEEMLAKVRKALRSLKAAPIEGDDTDVVRKHFPDIAHAYEQMFKDCCVMREALGNIPTHESDGVNGKILWCLDCGASDNEEHKALCYIAAIEKALSQVAQYPKPE